MTFQCLNWNIRCYYHDIDAIISLLEEQLCTSYSIIILHEVKHLYDEAVAASSAHALINAIFS